MLTEKSFAMRVRQCLAPVALSSLAIFAASSAQGESNRVFMSTNGNNVSDCANPLTPCLTFAGALAQVNPGGEVIAEATGGYGPLTITKSVTISGPAGVVIYSGAQVTVNAPGSTVELRGLTIDGTGASTNGIDVVSVGTVSVTNCVIKSFAGLGIHMGVSGSLVMKNTEVKSCAVGVQVDNTSGTARISMDHCHLDDNGSGFQSNTVSPGGSTTTAIHTTANNNSEFGWASGLLSSGLDLLNLEFCSASENGLTGLAGNSANPSSIARFSNCVLANNRSYGVESTNSGVVRSRMNNSITGNVNGWASGFIFQDFPQ